LAEVEGAFGMTDLDLKKVILGRLRPQIADLRLQCPFIGGLRAAFFAGEPWVTRMFLPLHRGSL
jgi:hypothetical protein